MSLWLNSCSEEEMRGYLAPFPSEEYKQGARRFPMRKLACLQVWRLA
jgi:hypothetical protein